MRAVPRARGRLALATGITVMTATHPDLEVIPLSIAAASIGTPERPLGIDTLRRRAAQAGALYKTPDGRAGITRQMRNEMRRNYRTCGYLLPRGGKRLEENRRAVATA
jgi:hypothetical protein